LRRGGRGGGMRTGRSADGEARHEGQRAESHDAED
jgi:hypothetical protein